MSAFEDTNTTVRTARTSCAVSLLTYNCFGLRCQANLRAKHDTAVHTHLWRFNYSLLAPYTIGQQLEHRKGSYVVAEGC